MWEWAPHAGVHPPIEPVSQWTIPEKNQKGGAQVVEGILFCFTSENFEQNKASVLETLQNCVTPYRNFKA